MATDVPTPNASTVPSRIWGAGALRWLSTLFVALVLFAAPALATPEISAAPTWTTDLEVVEPAVPSEWITTSAPYLRIHTDASRRDTMIRVADHGAEALPRLSDVLDVPVGGTIHVYIVGSDEEFRRLQPGAPPLWADAVAYPALGAIYLRDPAARAGTSKPLEQVFDHELVHVLLGRAFAPQVPPSWLQEGVAQVLAGEYGPQTATEIHDGIAAGGLIPLWQLESGFPRDAHRARLAYAESADFVGWLQAEHGPDVIQRLVAATADGTPMPAAVRGITGQLIDDVESDWASRFPSRLTLGSLDLLSEPVLFGLGGILLAVGGFQRKRRFHQRMEELAREEAIVDELLARRRFQQRVRPTTPFPGAWTSA